jgi:surface antigen
MPMNSNEHLSSYLVRPNLTPKRYRRWVGFRTRLLDIRRSNPRIIPRLIVALTVWSLCFASIRYVSAQHSLAGQTAFATSGTASVTNPATLTSAPAALSRAVPANSLTTGPSGQLLPPGALAPDRSYANTYMRGQCTWYVASRRHVPNGWGNARQWYYNAIASGWRVGTTPAVGAIAWTSAGWYGHVALVEQVSADHKRVYISEMNYVAPWVKSHRWVSATSFKYIY